MWLASRRAIDRGPGRGQPGTRRGRAGVIRLNHSGGSCVLIGRGLGFREARGKAGRDMSSQPQATGSLRRSGVSDRTLLVWRLLSAIVLLAMGGIHLYLVF